LSVFRSSKFKSQLIKSQSAMFPDNWKFMQEAHSQDYVLQVILSKLQVSICLRHSLGIRLWNQASLMKLTLKHLIFRKTSKILKTLCLVMRWWKKLMILKNPWVNKSYSQGWVCLSVLKFLEWKKSNQLCYCLWLEASQNKWVMAWRLEDRLMLSLWEILVLQSLNF